MMPTQYAPYFTAQPEIERDFPLLISWSHRYWSQPPVAEVRKQADRSPVRAGLGMDQPGVPAEA
jgi:hypothetical protein